MVRLRVPYSWGEPTATPGVFVIGGGDWVITWSPTQIHPYALQWIEWGSGMGPSGLKAPPQDLWNYSLQTKNLS